MKVNTFWSVYLGLIFSWFEEFDENLNNDSECAIQSVNTFP